MGGTGNNSRDINMPRTSYVIVTPAFNEAQYLSDTIKSVVFQTILPRIWVIVDDGSRDATPDIIQSYAKAYSWIRYVRREKEAGQTYYASNVYAILYGLTYLQDEDYDFLAVLDADIVLCPDYYEQVFERFDRYPELGIAAGTYLEKEGTKFVKARIDRHSTPKAIQVFRRACYEKAGGYKPFPYGGEDSGMEVMARMQGWQTWSFEEIEVIHNRPVGTAITGSILKARFNLGISDYSLGTHPLFMVFKSLKRCAWEPPYLLSGMFRMAGYCFGWLRQHARPLPLEARQYLREEQLLRLKSLVVKTPVPAWTPHEE